MTPVVIDASASVELIADTTRGRTLRTLLPADAVPWAPETFDLKVGSVLRRWDINAILTADLRAGRFANLLLGRCGSLKSARCSLTGRHRNNMTFAGALMSQWLNTSAWIC